MTKESIFVKCDKQFLTKSVIITFLITSIVVSATSYMLYYQFLINATSSVLIYILSAGIASFSLLQLKELRKQEYIYLTNDDIIFKNQNYQQSIVVKLKDVDHFETRFSEIILHTKSNDLVKIRLNAVCSEKSRWEIKDFLRNRIEEVKENRNMMLASA